MIKTLKFSTKEQNILFTSDLHVFHARDFVYLPRGYTSVDEHTIGIIEKWNSVVKPTDIVVNLGDFTLNSNVEQTKDLFWRLNGKQIFVFGNHESNVSKIYREELQNQFGCTDVEVYPLWWQDKVCFVGNELTLNIDGQLVFCSHFAHRIWDKKQHGVIHVSGHSHGSDPESQIEWKKDKRLDVGIDNFGCPVSFAEVKRIMDKKGNLIIDHHSGK